MLILSAARCRMKGSITVFMSLTLMIIAALLFTLLESGRVHGMKGLSRLTADSAMESLFSRYSDWIFNNYDIFLLDASFGGEGLSISGLDGVLQDYSARNLDPTDATLFKDGVNFYRMKALGADITDFLLASDYGGEAFLRMVCEQNRFMIGMDSAGELYERLTGQRNSISDISDMETIIDESTGEVDELIREKREDDDEEYEYEYDGDEPEETVDNPVDTVKEIMTKDILTLVLPKGKTLSAKELKVSETMEKREINSGTMEDVYEDNLLNIVFFDQYINTHLRCYSDGEDESDISHALDYEIEYIMGGNMSDRDNLMSVVTELMLIREGANFLYLQSDTVKRRSCLALAASILAPTGVGEAGAVILQQALLAAWAFVESVMDIRALLAGRRIDWMKTSLTWTSDIDSIAEAVTGGLMSEDAPEGDDYRAYLEKLIYLGNVNTNAFRVLEIIEANYRRVEGHENFRIDNCLIAAKAELEYKGDQLFLSFVPYLYGDTDYGSFHIDTEYHYKGAKGGT